MTEPLTDEELKEYKHRYIELAHLNCNPNLDGIQCLIATVEALREDNQKLAHVIRLAEIADGRAEEIVEENEKLKQENSELKQKVEELEFELQLLKSWMENL